MGAKGKVGMVVLSKVKTEGCSFMGGASPYGGVSMLLARRPQHLEQGEHRAAPGGPSGVGGRLAVSRKGESRCFTYWQHSGYRFGDQMGYLPWGSLQLREEGTGAGEKQWESR